MLTDQYGKTFLYQTKSVYQRTALSVLREEHCFLRSSLRSSYCLSGQDPNRIELWQPLGQIRS